MGYSSPEYQRAYRERNKEKLLQKKKEYYLKTKAHQIIKSREWAKKNPDSRRESSKKYEIRHPGSSLDRGRKYRAKYKHDLPAKLACWKYKITRDEYDRLLGSGCMVCGASRTKRNLHIDHDHATKIVRGVLCQQCNMGLGCFKDNAETMKLAITYLEAVR